MSKVFIGGSRRITRLNIDIRERLDRIMEKRLPVLIGDANGADKAVQQYLQSRHYDRVEVFCMEGHCRNNEGSWPIRTVSAADKKKDFNYYATKDRIMTGEASVGFMIWDGKSVGTLANVFRLVSQNKKVVVFIAPTKELLTFKDQDTWEKFASRLDADLKGRIEREEKSVERQDKPLRQAALF